MLGLGQQAFVFVAASLLFSLAEGRASAAFAPSLAPWPALGWSTWSSSSSSSSASLRMSAAQSKEAGGERAAAGELRRRDVDLAGRRNFLQKALGVGCGCGACLLAPHLPASAMVQLKAPPKEAVETYDIARNAWLDDAFARGMATGMGDYEEAAASRKRKLFGTMLASLPRKDAVVAEVGIGSFPNAPFFAMKEAPQGMDIIGIDPNDRMKDYALENARRARVISSRGRPLDPARVQNSLRIVHGVSEALPLEDASCDAVVCSLTLCSVLDPAKSVAEIKRVLKPGGKFVFWEHVLSETDPTMADRQIQLTPGQVKRADGCHLDRRTGQTIKAAQFAKIELDYFELENFGFLNPTVAGIATA